MLGPDIETENFVSEVVFVVPHFHLLSLKIFKFIKLLHLNKEGK